MACWLVRIVEILGGCVVSLPRASLHHGRGAAAAPSEWGHRERQTLQAFFQRVYSTWSAHTQSLCFMPKAFCLCIGIFKRATMGFLVRVYKARERCDLCATCVGTASTRCPRF